MDDLSASEAIISQVLGRLAPPGVNRVTLTFENLDPNGERKFSERLFLDAMHWLREEKIIRFERETRSTQLRMKECVLTEYGFSLLGQSMRIDGETQTVGERVKRVQAGEAQYAKAGSFFGGLLGAFTKSVSG